MWEQISGWAEASVIYTLLSTKDTPPTVIHAAHRQKKLLALPRGLIQVKRDSD